MSLLGVKQYRSRKGAEESKSGYVKHWLLKVLQGLQFYAHSPKDKAPESCPQITWLACPNNGLTKCASSNSMGNHSHSMYMGQCYPPGIYLWWKGGESSY